MHTPSQRRQPRQLITIAFTTAVLAPIAATAAVSGRGGDGAPAGVGGAAARAVGRAVAPALRDGLLRPQWRTSSDVAVSGVGDATAFHIMVARERAGYRWETVASLSEPGLETDRWIGNVCVSSSGRTAAAVYGPRQFTNKGDLFSRGGFAALVDLETGQVRKVPVRSTLAYYNPGCGVADDVSLSQFTGDDGPIDQAARTRVFRVNARTGRVASPVTLEGQITSAVPIAGRRFVAAGRRSLITVDARGRTRRLLATVSTPFHLAVDGAGGVVFMEHAAGVARVSRITAAGRAPRSIELARGALRGISTQQGTHGRVWITGRASTRPLPRDVHHLGVGTEARVSSEGHIAVSPATVDAAGNRPGEHPKIALRARVTATGSGIVFHTRTGGAVSAAGAAGNPLVAPELASAAVGSPTNPVDADATCSVPRNDATLQVYQPTPRQVEWAADQAVVGNLTLTRPANWNKSGLAA